MVDELAIPPAPPGAPTRKPRHRGFPRHAVGVAGLPQFDTVRIRREYFDAPETDWADYCAANRYNPALRYFPWPSWVREKKYRKAFLDLKADIEREGSTLGPRLLLQQLKAIRAVPDTASAMLSLIQHAIRVHLDEAKLDEPHLKNYREQGLALPKAMRFTLDPAGAAMLASALKQTTEVLHKSLGIDHSMGITPEKWAGLIEAEIGKVDGTQEMLTEGTKNPVQVEVMGAQSFREAMKDAFQKWMDKPSPEPPLLEQLPPPPSADVSADDASPEDDSADS